MAYPTYPYSGYQPGPGYYPGPVPDQLAQLRQNQMQQPMMQGPQMQQQPQPIQSQLPPANPVAGGAQNGMIWVSGRTEADGYLVAPNSAVALWDANSPVIYLRKADSTGKPSTVVYDLVERTENPPQQAVPQAPQVDLSNYITIEAAEEMIERRVNEILSERLKRPAKAAQKKEDSDNG